MNYPREPKTDGSSTERIRDGRDILSVDVAFYDWPQAFDRVDAALAAEDQTVFAFLNAHNANLAVRNPEFQDALRNSVVLPDGLGIDIAAKALHGQIFPANLNGTDFVPALLTYLERPLSVAMIGAKPSVLEAAQRIFSDHAPWHRFIAVSDGFFDEQQTPAVLGKLAEIQPDILLVAMGSPRQELWVARHVGPQYCKLVFCVGALFDFVARAVPRAPRLLRDIRSEWIFRLAVEPRRLWRRYLLGNPLFLYYVLRYKLSGQVRSSESTA